MKTKTFLLALFAQLFTLSASVYGEKVGGIYYNLNSTTCTAEVTYYYSSGGSYTSSSYTIPTNITYNSVNYRVTSIGYHAFYKCTSLTSVTIPSSINNIEEGAFESCTKLTSIIIPASVKTIKAYAFSGCSTLASITIPSSVTFIGNNAFNNTPWRTQWLAEQADGLCYINNVLYTYKGTIPENTSLIVEDGTTCIAGGAFYNQSHLSSIVLPESVTGIGDEAFYSCSSLRSITFPKSLELLGGFQTFCDCSSLESVELPKYTSSTARDDGYYTERRGISSNTFMFGRWNGSGCSSLTSVVFAEGTLAIPAECFSECTNLTTVTIPSTIRSIASTAFYQCNNLSTVRVGIKNPITIGSETFSNRFLATLYVPEGSKAAYEAAEFWQDFQEIVEVPEADIRFYTAPLETKANTQVTLSVNLSNSVTVQGFSFDLALPEGVTVALDEDDIEMVTLSTERTTTRKTNVFDFETNADGSLHVEASSTRGYTLDGEDGEVVQVVVNIAKGVKDGDYPLTFSNITVIDEEGNDYHPATSTGTLTVLPKDAFDLNDDGEVNIADVTLLVNFILGR